MNLDQLKRQAAARALDYVKSGMKLGLGTGSTAKHFVELLGERVRDGLDVIGVPTSEATRDDALRCGIRLTTLDEVDRLDLTVDGADEIDGALNLIKGGGGAMLREKIVASASKKMVVVTDSSKQVAALGKFPLPVEVIGFAEPLVAKKITDLGARVVRRIDAAGKPYMTDEGHHILDCHFVKIDDPPALNAKLCDLPGIVEHGLFVGMASVVLMAKAGAVEEFHG